MAGPLLNGTMPNSARASFCERYWIGSIVSRNGAIEETGLAAAVLNYPAMGIVWLANRLAAYGSSIAAGQLVQSGFFIRPVETAPGATITADYGASWHDRACHFASA